MSVEKWWQLWWLCPRLINEDIGFIVFDAVFYVGEAKLTSSHYPMIASNYDWNF